MTLHPGTDVKEITTTVSLTGLGNIQAIIIVWQLFTPALITDAIMQAAQAGDDTILTSLLQKLKEGAQLSPDEKKQAMLQAVILGDPEVLQALLQVPEIDVNAQYVASQTLLQFAAANGHKELVKLLLAANADNTTRCEWPYTVASSCLVWQTNYRTVSTEQ